MNKILFLIGGVGIGFIGGYVIGSKRKPIEAENPEVIEKQEVKDNTVEVGRAYKVLLNCMTDSPEDPVAMNISIQEALGYLGEALDD